MKSALVIGVVVSLLPSVAPVFAAEPRTEGIETAASGGLADRRVRSRDEMESAQTDGLGYSRGKRNGNDDWFEPMRFFEETELARTRSSSVTVRERSTAEPASASGSSDGVVTAGQEGSPAQQSDHGGSGKGIVNAGGASGNEGRGPNSPGKGKGIVNGWGGSSIHTGRGGDGAPSGKGIVNAAGGAFGHQGGGSSTGKGSAPIRPAGAGIVTGAGTAAVSAVANGSRGIVSAAGGQAGHHGKGEGRGHSKP